ncbi:MAG: hypothetical protein AAF351_10560 [Pseudomonadota bacterium]
MEKSVILVIEHRPVAAENLKLMIEFFDEPDVRTCRPDEWKSVLKGARLGALFVGPDVSDSEVSELLNEISGLERKIPVVMLNRGNEQST